MSHFTNGVVEPDQNGDGPEELPDPPDPNKESGKPVGSDDDNNTTSERKAVR